MMKPCKYDYSKFMDMDIFLSHCDRLTGRIIKIATLMKFSPRDDSTPTHGGFLTETYEQFFASEMKPRFTENSLKRYTGRFEQIVEVWRCKVFQNEDKREEARRYLSYLHREQKNYDASGAILSSPLGRAILGRLPWFKNNSEGHFCTEMVADILKKFADPKCPDAPNPLFLSKYFRSREGLKLYTPVKGFRVIL